MSFYHFVLFAHIVGAMAVFIGMGLEWVSLLRLRQARTVAQVREYTSLTSVQQKLVVGGAVHTPRFKAIFAAAMASTETADVLPEELERKIDDPVLWLSVQTHGITALGVIFLMTNKPDLIDSLITVGVTLVLSVITAQLWRPRRKTTAQAGFVGQGETQR